MKGKIPPSEWQRIFERHNAGESMAGIARDYGCTAPAIRYIVKRLRSQAGEPEGYAADKPAGAAALPAGLRLAGPARRASLLQQRERATSTIAAFLCALDAAAEQMRPETVDQLRDACDALMRAVARVRIEVERAALTGYGKE